MIDADGHILEPPDLWERYLEPKYRERAIRIKVDERQLEYLEIDGKKSKLSAHGTLGFLGGMGKEARETIPSPERTYLRGAPFGSMNAKERLQILDQEGIETALLYPTLGILWEAETDDPEISSAYCRAYNRWILEFCADSGGRLLPVAHLSLGDVDDAIRELERTVKAGAVGAFVAPFTITKLPHGHPDHDPLWAKAVELDVPIARFIQPLNQLLSLRTCGLPAWDTRLVGITTYSPALVRRWPLPRCSSTACSNDSRN